MNDVMRIDGRPVSDENIALVKEIKALGNQLHWVLEGIESADGRMMSLAKTNLEQAIMWASKALT